MDYNPPNQLQINGVMTETLQNFTCHTLDGEGFRLLIPQEIGPRILGLKIGNENLFAELPDASEDTSLGTYYFYGGHRLWHAPEAKPRTYVIDDKPPQIEFTPDGMIIVGVTEDHTHIQKSIQLTIDGNRVVVTHRLTNLGMWPITLAAWSITMFRSGGIGVLPQTRAKSDVDGLLSNRHLVLWPYASLGDPRLRFWEDAIHIHSDPTVMQNFKIGYPNTAGWLGYYHPELAVWFIKQHQHHQSAHYPDRGSSAECYCNPRFLELETLSPSEIVEPNQSITHTEHWSLWRNTQFEDLAGIVQNLAQG